MNPGKLLAFGAAGAAAWYFFLRKPASPAAVAPAGSPASGSAAKPSAGTLDAAYQRMVAKSSGKPGSVDDWDSWLMQGTPSIVSPDPLPVFQAAIPGFDRSRQMSAAEYWAVMSPVIAAQYGLSGLGFYGSMFNGGRW